MCLAKNVDGNILVLCKKQKCAVFTKGPVQKQSREKLNINFVLHGMSSETEC